MKVVADTFIRERQTGSRGDDIGDSNLYIEGKKT